MIQHKLNIGDVAASAGVVMYTCYGLGSCVGLFMQDRITGISGGAHIFLPEETTGEESSDKFYSAPAAISELLTRFKQLGSNLSTLRAKIVGGSNVMGMQTQTGERNAESIRQYLVENLIYIAATDVGGNYSRTATFYGSTGELVVRTPHENSRSI